MFWTSCRTSPRLCTAAWWGCFFVCLFCSVFIWNYFSDNHVRQEQNEMKEAHEKYSSWKAVFPRNLLKTFQLSKVLFFSDFPFLIFDPLKTPSLDFVVLISLPRQPTKRSHPQKKDRAARVSVIYILDIFLHCRSLSSFLPVFLSVYEHEFCSILQCSSPVSSLTQILCQGLSVCF